MSVKENKDLVRRYYEESSAIKGDSTKVRALVEKFFAPAFVAHAPVSGDMNFERTIQNRASLIAAFPDLNWIIYDMISEGDRVVARVAGQGTNKGVYQGIAATGKNMVISGVDIYRIAGGKFVELWAYLDTLGLMQQLGVIPSPSAKK